MLNVLNYILQYDKYYIEDMKMKISYNELLTINKISGMHPDLFSYEEEKFIENKILEAIVKEYPFSLKRELMEYFVSIIPEDLKENRNISKLEDEILLEKEKVGKSNNMQVMLSSRRLDDIITILMDDNEYCTDAKKRDKIENFINDLNKIDQNILNNFSFDINDRLLKRININSEKGLSIVDKELLKKISGIREKQTNLKI